MTDNKAQNSKDSYQHTRVNQSLLGAVEKKALLWMAARMPAWVVPDTLTMIGLFASVLIFLGYALTTYNKAFIWLASFGFLLNWFGDSLDGTLARHRKIERPRYGFFVDHIIDTVSEGLVFIGLGLSPYLRIELALLALVAYLWVSIYAYLATYVNGVFRISYTLIGPTEVRLIAILANTVVFFVGNVTYTFGLGSSAVSATFYDLVVIAITVFGVITFSYNSINTALILSREDRIIARDKRRARKAARRAERRAAAEERRAAAIERREAKARAAAEARRAPRLRARTPQAAAALTGDKLTIEQIHPRATHTSPTVPAKNEK